MGKKYLTTVLILLTGCASFHPEPISPTQTASAFESRSLYSADLKKYIEHNLGREISPWPPESWDFTLLVLASFYYHPDMDVARATWGVAQAEVVTAGGRPNPAISLFGRHHSMTAGGISPWTSGISLDIPVETAGKRGYRIRRAEHLSDAARLNIETTEWRVWRRLRNGLLRLYLATEKSRCLNERLAIQKAIVGMFDERLKEGETSQFEASLSRLDLDKILLQLSETKKQHAEARAAVAEALGLPATALDGIELSFRVFSQPPGPVSVENVRSAALLDRPDILAALSEYEATQSALQLEIARQYPDIHLGPGYEWDQDDNVWSLGITIELPIFNRNRGAIQEAEARRKQSAAKFTALQASVTGEIDRAKASYDKSLNKLQVAEALVSMGKSHLQIIQSRFAAGEADRLELETTRLELSAARLSRLGALASAQESLGALEDAVYAPLGPLEFPPPLSGSAPEKGAKE
jgi:cobalt-zinc-cadmium efflux system outer membrane protein